jgi:hypothetical protein
MSGESALHVRLVERLIATITDKHTNRRGIILLADHHAYGNDRPPQIGGFCPDVFASDVPTTFRVIGEAKTPTDLQSKRSHRQIIAFLDHLSLYPGSTFYLAVPWFSGAKARSIVNSLRRSDHIGIITEVVPFA